MSSDGNDTPRAHYESDPDYTDYPDLLSCDSLSKEDSGSSPLYFGRYPDWNPCTDPDRSNTEELSNLAAPMEVSSQNGATDQDMAVVFCDSTSRKIYLILTPWNVMPPVQRHLRVGSSLARLW